MHTSQNANIITTEKCCSTTYLIIVFTRQRVVEYFNNVSVVNKANTAFKYALMTKLGSKYVILKELKFFIASKT